MKKQDKTLSILDRRNQPHFVSKKFNKQLLSIVGSTVLLLGNYALIPVQAFADETATNQAAESTGTADPAPQLATKTISDPAIPETPTQAPPTGAETEPITDSDNQEFSTENEETTKTAPQDKTAEEEKASSRRRSPRAVAGDWVADEEGGSMVISQYTGDPTNIVVPSEIEGLPVQINLKTVLSGYLRATKAFAIEAAGNSGPVKLTGSFRELFYNNNNLTSAIFADADTSAITDMSYMFFQCRALTSLDVSNLNTGNVEDMSYMFNICTALTSLDVSNWDTGNVKNMYSMFYGAQNLISLDVANWDTGSVTDMTRMFLSCNELSSLDVTNWNTEHVESMFAMFSECKNLNSLNVSNWNTKNVKNMYYMFSNCSTLSNLDVSDWNTGNVEGMSLMFLFCNNLTSLDVSNWDTGSVTEMSSMFSHCNKLTSLDLSNWDIGSVRYMTELFYDCSNLTSLDLSNWDTGGKSMGGAFSGCSRLSKIICSKSLSIFTNDKLRDLPLAENNGKTTYHWVMDNAMKVFDSTSDFIKGHNDLSDNKVHTYTIQKKHEVTFDVAGGNIGEPAQRILENKKAYEPYYDGTKGNYQFGGWMLDGKVFDFGQTKITAPIQLTAIWRSNQQYLIQFNKNGGTGTMPIQKLNYDEEKTLLPNAFKKTGYAFIGWNTQADGQGEKSYTDQQPVKNLSAKDGETIELYAQWKIKTYTITFDSKDGEEIPAKEYNVETETFTLPELKRKGYIFEGWYDGETKVETIEKGSTGDKTLTAKWNTIEYTITFDSAGGSEVPDQSYTVETGIDKLATPTRKGYTFEGWYDGGEKVTSIKKGEIGDRNLTAQWKLNEYTISFNSQHGEAIKDKKYTVNTETITLPVLKETGYIFEGWYDGDNKVETIEKGSTGDKNLTAKWNAINYKVTFNSAGGSEVPDQSYTIEKGLDTFVTPTRRGYTFEGWYDGGKKVEQIKDGEIGDRSFTAQWKIIEYTITFDDHTMAPITYTIESDTITLPKKERLGYTFLGWLVTEETIDRVLSDQQMIVQEIEKGTMGNLKLSAQWQANSCTITFDPNGGTGELPPQTLTYDEAAKLSENKFTRAGYLFTGWNTQADGKGTAYTDKQEIKNIMTEPNGRLTLFAQWQTSKAALEDLANKEKETNRDKNKYTEDSWKKYEAAMSKAESVLANPTATAEEVNTALNELQSAIANLKLIQNAGQTLAKNVNHPTSTRKVYPARAKSYPGTGMLADSGLLIVGVAAVGTALAGWKKRKN